MSISFLLYVDSINTKLELIILSIYNLEAIKIQISMKEI